MCYTLHVRGISGYNCVQTAADCEKPRAKDAPQRRVFVAKSCLARDRIKRTLREGDTFGGTRGNGKITIVFGTQTAATRPAFRG